MSITFADSKAPNTLSFYNQAHSEGGIEQHRLFTVHEDGRIERGPAFTTDDAASLRFWEIMEQTGVVRYGQK